MTGRFDWADIAGRLRAWSASALDPRGNVAIGDVTLTESNRVLARTDGSRRLAVVGLSDIAVVVEDGGVLAFGLDRGEDVERAASYLADGRTRPFRDLDAALAWFDLWMRVSALPLWWALGADHEQGGFHDSLALDGRPAPGPRRVRVQARQAYVYAVAGEQGWNGPWREAVVHAFDDIETRFSRPDGLYRYAAGQDAEATAGDALTYDQAFVLFAAAAAHRAGVNGRDFAGRAALLREALQARRITGGGYRELGDRPFQSNANMHMFEAALAWARIDPAGWGPMADEIAALALLRLFDEEAGVVREVFGADWSPAAGEAGRKIEPGHQFEWAWLLDRWARLRGREDARVAARTLFISGKKGVDPARGVAMNGLRDDFSILDGGARLWPQTERLRSCGRFGDRDGMLDALNAIHGYLDAPVAGAWRERQAPDGGFIGEASPASSLYHLVGAWREVVPGPVNR